MSHLLRLPRTAATATDVASTEPPFRTIVEEAWRRHGAAVFALALVLSDDVEDAESVVVQAFLDACSPSDLALASLTRHDIARYVYVLWLRRVAESGVVAEIGTRRTATGTSGLPVLRGMSSLQRTAIALALFGEHTYQEIASLMELTPKNVAALMRSGLLAAGGA